MKRFSEFFTSLSHTDDLYGSVVGVDIGASSIKVVQIEQKRSTLTLNTYGELQLGPYENKALGQSVALSSQNERVALADVVRESAVTAKQAVFAMPLSTSFVTNVSIDAAPDADLAAMVRVEARKVIPMSLSEIALDWAEVESVGTKAGKVGEGLERHNVLIAAIQNTSLARFEELMNSLGLKHPPSEIECFSTIRGVLGEGDTHMAIIDFGAESTKLYLIHKGQLMRSHRVQAGGISVTTEIKRAFSLDFEQAEELKLSMKSDDGQFASVQRIYHDIYYRTLREFRQVIEDYEQKMNVKITSVQLTGGVVQSGQLGALTQEVLQKEITVADPFSKVRYPAFMTDVLTAIGPSFTVAIGAALRRFE